MKIDCLYDVAEASFTPRFWKHTSQIAILIFSLD